MITEFPTEYLPAALAIVAKANKRAAKQGITEQFTTIVETKDVKRIDPNTGLDIVRSMTTFEVVGSPLCFAGWTFVGTITWDSETGLAVTRPVPGTNVDLSAHRDAQRCDHCHTKRQRKDTYVVARTDGSMSTERVVKGSNPDGTWTPVAGPFTGDNQVEEAREMKKWLEHMVPEHRFMIIVGPEGTDWDCS